MNLHCTLKMLGTLAALAASTAMAQQDPWKDGDLIQPEAFAARLASSSAPKPATVFVGFPVLYRGAHIPGAIMAGPASKPEGLEALRQGVAKMRMTPRS